VLEGKVRNAYSGLEEVNVFAKLGDAIQWGVVLERQTANLKHRLNTVTVATHVTSQQIKYRVKTNYQPIEDIITVY